MLSETTMTKLQDIHDALVLSREVLSAYERYTDEDCGDPHCPECAEAIPLRKALAAVEKALLQDGMDQDTRKL